MPTLERAVAPHPLPTEEWGERTRAACGAPMSQAFISVEGLTRRFPEAGGGQLTVFENLWFTVAEGEFACVIGHSGCGKSTILNVLAGLDTPSEGHIIAAGREVAGPSLDRAVIFQGHALMPWLSALGNVELAVSSRHPNWPRSRVREHALRYLALVHLDGSETKKPAQLSGGMKQRVGIIRALATGPKVLLLDEPFGALDAQTRVIMQQILTNMWQRLKTSVLFVTHDIDEAIFLSDRVYCMTARPGTIKAEISIPLERPRQQAMMMSSEFLGLRRGLMSLIREESLKAIGGEINDVALQGLGIDLHGQTLADVI
jgi:sulfonate transport system ATP-binding protein